LSIDCESGTEAENKVPIFESIDNMFLFLIALSCVDWARARHIPAALRLPPALSRQTRRLAWSYALNLCLSLVF
jgi:hypothetical protein